MERVKVWDLPTRLFHWAVVACVIGSWVSVELLEDLQWHQRFGLTLIGLLVFRLLWGFVGSTTARFARFLRGPRAALAYLRGWFRGEAGKYTGHNPLGGWSVMALLLLLAGQAGLGLFANDELFFEGPLASLVSSSLSNRLTGIHETLFNVLLAVIVLHVLAAVVYLVRGDNLIWPMIIGSKRADRTGEPPARSLRFAGPLAFLVTAALAGAAVWGLLQIG
mgnify:CR=1 FL=1